MFKLTIIESEFQEKCRDIDVLLDHIKSVSYEKGSNVHKLAILKSSLVLLLYNTIESTVTSLLDEIHNSASNHQYNQLSDKLRALHSEYYFFNQNKKNLKKNLDSLSMQTLYFPTLDEFEKRVNNYSGNLDSREIDKTLSKYGVGKVRTEDRGKLLTVKNIRNKVSHGELMFKEACRNFTITELEEIKCATENAMNDIIQQTNHYLSRKGYLNNNANKNINKGLAYLCRPE